MPAKKDTGGRQALGGPVDLVLEIGTEEIPARFMPAALEQLAARGRALLKEARLGASDVLAYGTPRRLVLIASGVASRQDDRIIEVKGPARKAAYDPEGRPTKAAEGFARSQGVTPADLTVRTVAGGEYVFALKTELGRTAEEVLGGVFPAFITKLEWPKLMRWGDHDLRFVRPIKWLLALYQDRLIPFSLDGVSSGRETLGHRFLSPKPHRVGHAAEYLPVVRRAQIVVDPAERRTQILAQIRALAEKAGGRVLEDPSLLDEVTYLVEYPTALLGRFNQEYLAVPADILITTMKHHQRYFPVVDAKGHLMPLFITVRNGDDCAIDVVRAGNERVLRARLADGKFFFEEDLARPLRDRVAELDGVSFQERLGTMGDKTHRLEALVVDIAGDDAGLAETARHAAHLAKADLVTSVVKEFPELQGRMGRVYADKAGEPEAVAAAIGEQYRPAFAGDDIPATPAGRLLALADKVDTLSAAFGTGIVPTGSQDPYGLRRAAQGVVAIILGAGLRLSLSGLVDRAFDHLKGIVTAPEGRSALLDFLRQRLQASMDETGLRYDVIEATLSAGFDDLTAALARARALSEVRDEGTFADVVTAFTRAANLAGKAPAVKPIDPGLFQHEAERRLLADYEDVAAEALAMEREERYADFLRSLSRLRPAVDAFFDAVMVMVEDELVRDNRLNLLRSVSNLATRMADLSKLVPAKA
ncbi:MAG TPA: glycine--tRNA ligase subunit beta [Bacillota bacterium]|jgi:glycyl-tRNA synthetase beta chain